MIVQVDSSVSDKESQDEAKQAPRHPEDGAVVPEPKCHKESHVNGHEKHELTVRRRLPVLLEQLCAVPDMNCLFRTRLLSSVLEDVVEGTVTYCPEAVEEGVEVPFVGKHCELCNHHH